MSDLTAIPVQPDIDISENEIREKYPSVLEILLRDHTTQKNIFWGTDNYQDLGPGYSPHDPILPELITGKHNKVIMPRVKKAKLLQTARVRSMAEVFTPSWICNMQNNLVDEAWFGRKDVFNIEEDKSGSGFRWKTVQDKILFPEGKNWKDYVRSNRLEITCGEAPYITSRYDTTTGVFIPVEQRIGLLDRKLRIVSENTEQSGEWLKWAQAAYMSTYAFEWQGDSLLLARESMLYAFIENYVRKFGKTPQLKSIGYIAYIISWNVWQMDGLKFVVPESCHDEKSEDLFGKTHCASCYGCAHDDNSKHNGSYCLIKDWTARDTKTKKRGRKITFYSLMRGRSK